LNEVLIFGIFKHCWRKVQAERLKFTRMLPGEDLTRYGAQKQHFPAAMGTYWQNDIACIGNRHRWSVVSGKQIETGKKAAVI